MTPGRAAARSYRDVASARDMFIVTVHLGIPLENNRFEQVCVFVINNHQPVALCVQHLQPAVAKCYNVLQKLQSAEIFWSGCHSGDL
jgi:hypothetical protein